MKGNAPNCGMEIHKDCWMMRNVFFLFFFSVISKSCIVSSTVKIAACYKLSEQCPLGCSISVTLQPLLVLWYMESFLLFHSLNYSFACSQVPASNLIPSKLQCLKSPPFPLLHRRTRKTEVSYLYTQKRQGWLLFCKTIRK